MAKIDTDYLNDDEARKILDAANEGAITVSCPSYNHAMSLAARLNRFMRGSKEFHGKVKGPGDPYQGLVVEVRKSTINVKRAPEFEILRHTDLARE